MKYQKAAYWFTNDLRLSNNTLLSQMANEVDQACFIYVIDETEFAEPIFQNKGMGDSRKRFLLDSLQSLFSQLTKMGHRLLVFSGDPKSIVKQLAQTLALDAIYVGKQIGWHEAAQIDYLQTELSQVSFEQVSQNLLFELSHLLDDSNLFNSFTRFRKYVESSTLEVDSEHDLQKVLPRSLLTTNRLDIKDVLEKLLALRPKTEVKPYIRGGEAAAAFHLSEYFNTSNPSSYKETRNALDEWSSSTKLSAYLANGNVSVKAVWQEVGNYEALYGSNDSTYWIKFELLWREFFQWLAVKSGTKLFSFNGNRSQSPLTCYYPERFQKWTTGNTPYPIVNACIKQLNTTGYISNRGRQLVASCFVNELALDWRYGAAYFQQQLIDYDVAANWGNWQYIAGVGVDPRGGRHFNLAKQTAMYDADSAFINKWANKEVEPLDSLDIVDWPLVCQEDA